MRTLVGDAFDPADAAACGERVVADASSPPSDRRSYLSSSFISSVSLDCAARMNGVAPSSKNHCIVKMVRVSVLSLTFVFGFAPFSSSSRDDVEVIHVRLGNRIVAALDVAVVGRQIERRPAALVGDVGIGALLEQELRQLIVAVVDRGEQRRPAVLGDLIDRRAGVEQQLAPIRGRLRARRTSAASDRRRRCRPDRRPRPRCRRRQDPAARLAAAPPARALAAGAALRRRRAAASARRAGLPAAGFSGRCRSRWWRVRPAAGVCAGAGGWCRRCRCACATLPARPGSGLTIRHRAPARGRAGRRPRRPVF